MTRRSVGVEFALGALLALVIAVLVMLFAPYPVHAQTAAACHQPADLGDLYAPDEVVAYGYDGDAGAAIIRAAGVFGPWPAGKAAPASAFVLLDVDDASVTLFFFDAGDCFVAQYGPMEIPDAAAFLTSAGVAVPFGQTFHQLPALPGINA